MLEMFLIVVYELQEPTPAVCTSKPPIFNLVLFSKKPKSVYNLVSQKPKNGSGEPIKTQP
jgi:hypothetical protein